MSKILNFCIKSIGNITSLALSLVMALLVIVPCAFLLKLLYLIIFCMF